jgi:hypothetical protein
MSLSPEKGSSPAPRFGAVTLVAGIEKKTPLVEKRGFQSRPGLEGRHHSRPLNAPSAN